MTAVSKIVYFNMLDDIFNEYLNTVHRTRTMIPIDVTSDFYAKYNEGCNETKPKLKAGDRVRISKYKNIFAKEYTQIGQKKLLLLVKLRIEFRGLMLLVL